MRAWLVKEGTEVITVKFKGSSSPKLDSKVTNKEVLYFDEDVAIDPIGKFGVGPQHRATIGGEWASKGYYGFKIPANKSGYEILLVHASNVIVG